MLTKNSTFLALNERVQNNPEIREDLPRPTERLCDPQSDRVIDCKTERFRRSGYLGESDVPSELLDLPRETLLCSIGVLNTILDVCYLHHMFKPNLVCGDEPIDYVESLRHQLQESLIRFAHYHRAEPSLTSWIKYWKYKLCAYFSACEKDILPPKPQGFGDDRPDRLFGGVIGQFLRLHQRRQPGVLAYSLMMSKKGMPRAGEVLVKEAEKKMVDALTTERETIEVTLPHTDFSARCTKRIPTEISSGRKGSFVDPAQGMIRLGRHEMEHELRRTVREIFGGYHFGPGEMSNPVFPSPNGNYNRTRSALGGVGCVKEECGDINFEVEFSLHEATFFEPVNMYYGEKGEKFEETSFPHDNARLPVGVVDFTPYIAAYRRLYWRLFRKAMDEEPYVQPVGLPEALKIRVISKGPPLTYFVLKSFQKFMWKRLSKFKAFRLISRPVESDDILEICRRDGAHMLSGDYVSSTDNIHSWATETVVDEMKEVLGLPGQLVDLLLRALTRHIFVEESSFYNLSGWNIFPHEDSNCPWSGNDEKAMPGNEPYLMGCRKQKTGQLMGSIVSFPILCMINFTGCRKALECADGREYKLSSPSLRLLINGDDCLLASHNTELYEWWRRILSVLGLEESVGKTYYNNRFAVINSSLFDYCYGSQSWIERQYVNMGLIKGLKRSAGAEDRTAWDVALCFNDLKRTCPAWQWEEAERLFLKYNRKVLQTYNGPWYFPRYAGGLGMEKEVSLLDRMVLRAIQERGLSERVLAWPAAKPWQTWELARRIHEELQPLRCEVPYRKILCTHVVDLESEQEAVSSMLCWKALLSHTQDELFQSLDEKVRGRAAMNRNFHVYAKGLELVKGSSFFKPVEEDYIWEERKRGYVNAISKS